MSEVMEDRYQFIAHKIAAIIGIIIIMPTLIYWVILLLSNFGSFRDLYFTFEKLLPRQFFFYNFVSPILTYWLNKIVITRERNGDKIALPINSILIMLSFILIICQVAHIIFKG
tara:strand:+ start:319 stop:660 length:342 start_codon:yes stop_codon:yes gene_type:complete